MDPINALCPLDGRYSKTIAPLRAFFSESAYIRYRIVVEIAWLKALSAALPQLPPFSPAAIAHLDSIPANFTDAHAARVKELEATTNHDVKAIECVPHVDSMHFSSIMHTYVIAQCIIVTLCACTS